MADAVNWPRIEGVDMQLAQLRAGGDLELFRALLQSFMLEFGPESAPHVSTDQAELLLHAKYLHKLCGGAGQLGATTLQELAGAAETAARTGNVARVSRLMLRVSFELRRLHANARRLLNERPSLPASSPDQASALDTPAVRDLVGRLRAQELDVLDSIAELAAPLQARLGVERSAELRTAIKALRFADAAALLEAHLETAR